MANSSHIKDGFCPLRQPHISLQPCPVLILTAGASTHRGPSFEAKKRRKIPYISMPTQIYTHIPPYTWLKVYKMCVYTQIKTAIPAGSSHLPQPKQAEQPQVGCLAQGWDPQGCASPKCHPRAGSARVLCPGATQWQVSQEKHLRSPGSLYSCCFHTQGFCRAGRG